MLSSTIDVAGRLGFIPFEQNTAKCFTSFWQTFITALGLAILHPTSMITAIIAITFMYAISRTTTISIDKADIWQRPCMVATWRTKHYLSA